MKTLFAPDTAAAMAAAAQGFLASNPAAAFALVTILAAAFAAYAVKHI